MPSNSRDLDQYADHLQRLNIKLEKVRLQLEMIRQMLADAKEFKGPT